MCQRNSFVFNRSGLNCDFQLVRCLFLTSSLFSWLCFFTVGAGDHAPLPADALPAGRDSGGSERRQQHSGETGQEQTASPDLWERRETGPGAQGRQICGVFGSDAGTQREEEEVPCFIGRSQDTWAASTQEIMTLLWNKLADNSDFRGLFYTSRCGCDYSVISRLLRSVLVINRKWPGFFFFFINLEKGFWKMTASARISAERVRSKCTDTEYVSRCSC